MTRWGAYRTVARQEPALRLLPPSSEEPRAQITDGQEADPQPSQVEARAALERVRGLLAQIAPKGAKEA